MLRGGKGRNESQIRQDVGRLFDLLKVDNIVEYATPDGPCDLIIQRHRIIIETKRPGMATYPDKPQSVENDETPREQMERYMLSEIKYELEITSPNDEDFQDCPWIGIVTDGHVWHAWQYEHVESPYAVEVFRDLIPPSGKDLVVHITNLLNEPIIGKPWVPRDFPKRLSRFQNELQKIYHRLKGKTATEAKTKFDLWLEMLKTSGMAPSNPEEEMGLFVKHSLLVAVARGVIHTLANPFTKPIPKSVLHDGFVAWIIATGQGVSWASELLDEIHKYEWRRQHEDLLRPVYEELIEPSERKDFGEVYTPDWLAAMIVEEVLDDDWCNEAANAALTAGDNLRMTGTGVLDPACGSGTFLYHSCKKLLRAQPLQSSQLPKVQKAGAVARLVNGIDVHPIAAEVARATVLRALPAEPPDGEHAIQVILGDSLLAHREKDQNLFGHSESSLRVVSPKGHDVHIPKSFVEGVALTKNMRLLVEMAEKRSELPDFLLASVPPSDRPLLNRAKNSLENIISEEGDSIWAWFVINMAGPVLLSERKIDRIVANPPWVHLSQIQVVERKRDLEEIAQQQGLWIGGAQAPNFDIAQLFIKRCRELYMNNAKVDKAGWLVKRSAMTGGNWAELRKWHEGILEQTINLEEVQPFGGGDSQRCCILLDHHKCRVILSCNYHEIRAVCDGKRPEPYLGWNAAKKLLKFRQEPERFHRQPSGYVDQNGSALFRTGAPLSPKVLVVIASATLVGDNVVRIYTEESMHKPWSKIPSQTGDVPRIWVRDVYASNDIVPFGSRSRIRKAVVPTTTEGILHSAPGKECKFWESVEAIWADNLSEGKRTPKTLIENINFNNKLSRQLMARTGEDKRLVVQVGSGDIMRAARLASNSLVDSTLQYWWARCECEAAYLVGMLNAPNLNKAYVDSRNSGRDFINFVWTRVPIPKYNSDIEAHRNMAAATSLAEELVNEYILKSSDDSDRSQVSVSRDIRSLLCERGVMEMLIDAAEEVLPSHVTHD